MLGRLLLLIIVLLCSVTSGDQFGRAFYNITKWHEQACPAELAAYNCYFQNFKDRAEKIDKWRPSRNTFTPKEIASKLTNKRVFFIGDSIILQAWISLVCYLYGDVEGTVHTKFEYRDWLGERLCPWGDDHCEPKTGSYAVFGTTEIYYLMETTLYPERLHHHHSNTIGNSIDSSKQNAFDEVVEEYSITPNDVIIMNFGLWFFRELKDYNQPTTYEQELKILMEDVYRRKLEHSFYWLETTPQHFSNGRNVPGIGYFHHDNLDVYDNQARTYLNSKPKDERRRPCADFKSVKEAYAADFRNRIADDVFNRGHSDRIKIIRTWDSLAPMASYHLMFPHRAMGHMVDCTHWCLPGPLTYVLVNGFFDVYKPFQLSKGDGAVGGGAGTPKLT